MDYIEKIREIYGLGQEELAQLREAASYEQQKAEIKLQSVSEERKYAALSFARNFDKLSDEQLEEIRRIIEEDSD